MLENDPPWLAHRRKLFMRPDAWRYLKPGSAGYAPPAGTGYLAPAYCQAVCEPDAPAEAKAAQARADDAARTYRYELAALRFELQLLKLSLGGAKTCGVKTCGVKANFDPAQPRDDEGRWTDAGTSEAVDEGGIPSDRGDDDADSTQDFSAARRKAKGHHHIPTAELTKRNISSEAREIFDRSTTGPLYDKRSNKWDEDHRVYSKAVGEKLDEYLLEKGTQPEKMTADQAREFLGRIFESRDPRIRSFNMSIQIREIMQRLLRRGGRE